LKEAEEVAKKLKEDEEKKKAEGDKTELPATDDAQPQVVVIPVSTVVPTLGLDGDEGSEKDDDDNDENVPPSNGLCWVEVQSTASN